MKIKNKILSGMTGIATIATPIATVVACEAPYTGDIYMVTDGGSVDDKSFNEQAYVAFHKITGAGKKTVLQGRGNLEIDELYSIAASVGAKTVIAAGFLHEGAVKKYLLDHADNKMNFILLDGEIKNAHVASIKFKTKQSGFLAGYLASQYLVEVKEDRTPTLGTFGGLNIPSVTDFMVGFIEGTKYYNDHHTFKIISPAYPQQNIPEIKESHVKFIQAKNKKKDLMTNTGFKKGKGRAMADYLILHGADVIMGASGPQTDEVATAIDQGDKDIKLIGVDTDQSITTPRYKNYFLSSIKKEIASTLVKVYNKIHNIGTTKDATINGLDALTWGTLANGGTSIVKPSFQGAEGIYDAILKNTQLQKAAADETENVNWDAAYNDLVGMA